MIHVSYEVYIYTYIYFIGLLNITYQTYSYHWIYNVQYIMFRALSNTNVNRLQLEDDFLHFCPFSNSIELVYKEYKAQKV